MCQYRWCVTADAHSVGPLELEGAPGSAPRQSQPGSCEAPAAAVDAKANRFAQKKAVAILHSAKLYQTAVEQKRAVTFTPLWARGYVSPLGGCP